MTHLMEDMGKRSDSGGHSVFIGQVRADKIANAYTVVFFYNKTRLAERGINTDKLRIAFYNGRTKTWSLVGANNYAAGKLTASVRDAGIFTLIEIN